MKEIKVTKYQAVDGSIWDTAKECQYKEDNIMLHQIHDLVIKLFNKVAEKHIGHHISNDGWLELEINEVDNRILFNFNCSNRNYTKAIGEFYILLSDMPHSFISFKPKQTLIELSTFNCREDIEYLNKKLNH